MKINSPLKIIINKIILKHRLTIRSKPPNRKQNPLSLSNSTLSALYTSWSNLPLEEKSDYKVLRDHFKRNYITIKNTLRPKFRPKILQQTLYNKGPSIIDLKEKCRKSKLNSQSQIIENPMKKFVNSIKRTIQEISYKTSTKKSLTSVLKNSIFDSYISHDEPFRDMQEAELSKIPFKEQLLITCLKGDLYISGIKAASDSSLLMKNQIKAVVSIGNCKQSARFTSITGGYLILPMSETEDQIMNFKDSIQKAMRFIEIKLKEGNVLVSCFYGVCRSCAIVIAFLMKKYMIHFDKALAVVKAGRKCCELSASANSLLSEIEFKLFSLG